MSNDKVIGRGGSARQVHVIISPEILQIPRRAAEVGGNKWERLLRRLISVTSPPALCSSTVLSVPLKPERSWVRFPPRAVNAVLS